LHCLEPAAANEYLVLEPSPAVSNASSGGVYSVTIVSVGR